ncbi:MAG: glycosyltransferase family 2 protein [Deltaproteobacteria bacterium]|nr:glycosyltransferase family 2 protein [Deltaproteobacteria bacterium]
MIENAEAIDRRAKVYWESILNLLKIKTELFLADPDSVLEFPKFEAPVVSILLVTYNRAEYTFQCLETVKAHSDVPYEVIIVDNASADQTRALLDRVKNITVLKNDENAGFLKACNQGVKQAKGKHILFLNNDTQVGPRWLTELVSTMETYPDCGAVGAKMIMPDGRLQEAGSIIWRDGSTTCYGRGANPFAPEFSHVREVDYCGGACLLVRKDLFFELGGFDERYAPAYYEESDLCLGIRRRGRKVVFQPDVSVIHYEYGSGSFKKALKIARTNQGKFLEKWRKSLEEYYAPSDENILYARDKRNGPRILMIDDKVPAAGKNRAFEVMTRLADSGCVVTLLVPEPSGPLQPGTKHLRQMGVEVLSDEEKIDVFKLMAERKNFYDLIHLSGRRGNEINGRIKEYFPKASIIDGDPAEILQKIDEVRKT